MTIKDDFVLTTTAKEIAEAVQQAVKDERARCAELLDDGADRLIAGKKRVSQVDQHTASVLRRYRDMILQA
jgi:hypothetical protein